MQSFETTATNQKALNNNSSNKWDMVFFSILVHSNTLMGVFSFETVMYKLWNQASCKRELWGTWEILQPFNYLLNSIQSRTVLGPYKPNKLSVAQAFWQDFRK